MALSQNDQTRIREYLLGRLNDEEQQQIEEQLMVDDELFEELEISKGELIEEYSAGALSQKEQQWFEVHYLASQEGKERHTFALALDCLKRPDPTPQPLTWHERLRTMFINQPLLVAGASASLVIVIVGLYLITRPVPQTSMAFTLNSSMAQRGSNDAEVYRVKLKDNVGELRITLTLPDSTPLDTNYRAELDNGISKKAVTVARREAKAVVVTVPAAETPTGFYVFRLFVTQPNTPERQVPGDYRFIVE